VIRRSALPLLGATAIAILAFAPIGLSDPGNLDVGKAVKNPISPVVVPASQAPCQEVVFRADDPDFDLRKLLPAPTNTPIDAGPFFCLGLVLASDPEDASLTDVTIHRLCVQERDELSMFLAAGRHIEVFRQKAEKAGKALNDEVQAALQGELLQEEIRLGMQEDFGESLMPGILGEFKRHHPAMRIIARVDRNRALLDAFDANALDMVLLWQTEEADRQGKLIGQCQMEWIQHPDLDLSALLAQGEPLPLVMFEHPCLMRAHALAYLNRAGIPWRVVFVSHSLSGIWAAVQAGLGITLRTRIGMPGNLRVAGRILPVPGSLGITLKQHHENEAEHRAQALLGELMEAALLNVK
jgi:DNA-binding transcriptional LysR family regulator